MQKNEWVIGIDEVGRGPLAGPVAVGVAMVPSDFDWQEKLPGVTDSKKLSEKKREEIFAAVKALQSAGELNFAVALVSAKVIDAIGIVPAVRRALERSLGRLEAPIDATVKLDGGLRAPAEFTNQETIIKGDALEPVIGLASICAKVTRDRYMVRIAGQFAPYDFHIHKGYGTKAHRAAIARYGLSSEHRASFCQNIKNVVL